MALLELASSEQFGCSWAAVCLDRKMEPADAHLLIRDLGWVGFEITTLAPWFKGVESTSDEWLFLVIEL